MAARPGLSPGGGAGLGGLVLALAFLAAAAAWDAQSAISLHYGDAIVNEVWLLEAHQAIHSAWQPRDWTAPEIWAGTPRAPLLYWAGLGALLMGLPPTHLWWVTAIALAVGGLALSVAVGRAAGSAPAGWVAAAVFLGSHEVVIQAHGGQLGAWGAACTAVALVGVEGVERGRRFGALWLGLGLGLALIARHNTVVSLGVPIALWALWRGVAALRGRAPWTLAWVALVPVLSLAAAAALRGLWRDSADVGPFLLAPPMLVLPVVLGCVGALWVGRAAPDERRARALALGLAVAAAVALPWWWGAQDQIQRHAQNSLDADYRSWAAIPGLLGFMGQSLSLRGVGVLWLGPAVLGALWALLGRGAGTLGRLSLLGLVWAAGTSFMYFKARYLVVLLPFIAVLCGGLVPRSRAPGMAAGVVAVLVLFWRLGGWAVAPVGSGLPIQGMRDENTDWHQPVYGGPSPVALRAPFWSPWATVAPVAGPDPMELVVAQVRKLCSEEAPCNLMRATEPPASWTATLEMSDWVSWRLQQHGLLDRRHPVVFSGRRKKGASVELALAVRTPEAPPGGDGWAIVGRAPLGAEHELRVLRWGAPAPGGDHP